MLSRLLPHADTPCALRLMPMIFCRRLPLRRLLLMFSLSLPRYATFDVFPMIAADAATPRRAPLLMPRCHYVDILPSRFADATIILMPVTLRQFSPPPLMQRQPQDTSMLLRQYAVIKMTVRIDTRRDARRALLMSARCDMSYARLILSIAFIYSCATISMLLAIR